MRSSVFVYLSKPPPYLINLMINSTRSNPIQPNPIQLNPLQSRPAPLLRILRPLFWGLWCGRDDLHRPNQTNGNVLSYLNQFRRRKAEGVGGGFFSWVFLGARRRR